MKKKRDALRQQRLDQRQRRSEAQAATWLCYVFMQRRANGDMNQWSDLIRPGLACLALSVSCVVSGSGNGRFGRSVKSVDGEIRI